MTDKYLFKADSLSSLRKNKNISGIKPGWYYLYRLELIRIHWSPAWDVPSNHPFGNNCELLSHYYNCIHTAANYDKQTRNWNDWTIFFFVRTKHSGFLIAIIPYDCCPVPISGYIFSRFVDIILTSNNVYMLGQGYWMVKHFIWWKFEHILHWRIQ